jgi:hypothetical protein
LQTGENKKEQTECSRNQACIGRDNWLTFNKLQNNIFLAKSVSICASFEYINPYLIRNAKIEIENEMTKIYFGEGFTNPIFPALFPQAHWHH